MKKILLLIFGLFLLLPLINAVEIVDFYWTNSQTNTLEINYGESAQFEAYVADGFSDFSVNIFLEDSIGFITPIFNRVYNARDEAEIVMLVTSDYYQRPGSYTLHINAINNDQDRMSDELFLVIRQQPQQNHAPTIELIGPRNGAQNVPLNINLVWQGSDEDNDELTYDIYLNNNLIADDIIATQYQLVNLQYNTIYNWQVIANDGELETRSDAWNFRTIEEQVEENHVPYAPSNPNPRNGAVDVSRETRLSWNGGDPDGDAVTYDVYLNNRLICDNARFAYCFIGDRDRLDFNTIYKWYVVASDGELTSKSPLWSFTTERIVQRNNAPTINLINPLNGDEDVSLNPILRWDGNDVDGNELYYTIYYRKEGGVWTATFGDITEESYQLNLRYETIYEWYVVVSDGKLETRSDAWSFTTEGGVNQAPVVDFITPNENILINGIYTIKWNSNDVDGEIVNTKLYYKKNGFVNDYLFFWLDSYNLLIDMPGNPRDYDWDTTRFRNGIYSLKIVVTDNNNANGEDIVDKFKIINRIQENHAPRIISQPVTSVKVNTIYSYDVNAVDADNDHITYSLTNAPAGMIINSNTGVILWSAKDIGQFLVTVRATDEHGAFDSQTFAINALTEEISLIKVHEFNINNVILQKDNQYINVYVKLDNDGNYNEKIQLKAINMNTGDITYDSFLLENGDGYWRILRLPKPSYNNIYTIGILGNSKDYKDILYRDIII